MRKDKYFIFFYVYVLVLLFSIGSIAQNLRIENKSYITNCAEHDNINIPIYGTENSTIIIRATHPSYEFTDIECPADFSGSDCNITCSDTSYIFVPDNNKIFDDGFHAIWVHSKNEFWRPNKMKVIFNNGLSAYGHYLSISKKIEGRNEWPQYLILYCDSYLRILPQPPQGLTKTCFGSSIIVGPAEGIQASTCYRPYCDIDSILVDTVGTSSVTIDVWYHNGSTGSLKAYVNTEEANVEFSLEELLTRPLITLRSMWIDTENCDVDSISCEQGNYSILSSWSNLGSNWFKFYRSHPSVHNNSAPDIKIEIKGTVDVLNTSINNLRSSVLSQNFPNPFNPSTTINYYLKKPSNVTLKVYNISGQEIENLVDEFQTEGEYKINWHSNNLPSGVYFYKLKAGRFLETKKIILQK